MYSACLIWLSSILCSATDVFRSEAQVSWRQPAYPFALWHLAGVAGFGQAMSDTRRHS